MVLKGTVEGRAASRLGRAARAVGGAKMVVARLDGSRQSLSDAYEGWWRPGHLREQVNMVLLIQSKPAK